MDEWFLVPEQGESFQIWHAALLMHQILCDIVRTVRHRIPQHLGVNLDPIGQPPALPPPALFRAHVRRFDKQAHEGEISLLNGELDRERLPAVRRRAVLEQKTHDGYRADVHGAHERIAVVRVCVGLRPPAHLCVAAV